MSVFNLEIITPLKVEYKSEVDMIIARTTEGDIGIKAKHTPIVTELAIGEMKIKKNEEELKYFIAGGFLEVSKEKVLILADKAIKAEEIDIVREREAIALNEAKLSKMKEDKDIAATQKALNEALVKVKIGESLK